MRKIIIAIDGPAGSGKTSTAKILSQKLNYIYIDTGAMYRAITLAWIRSGLQIDNDSIVKVLDSSKIDLSHSPNGQITLLNGEDVSGQIRSREVNKYVSPISANENVRRYLVDLQKELCKNKQCVIEGRDIGSVVCPDAELKIYMFATIGARAKRRLLEFEKMGITDVTFDEIAIQINERDKYDSSRENSPLQKVESAIDVDTTELTLEQQVEKIYKLAIEIINK